MILKTLQRQAHPLASPVQQIELLQDPNVLGTGRFVEVLKQNSVPRLSRRELTTLQINVGKVCNQTCGHCHVDAGPDRREAMSLETADQVIDFLRRSQVRTFDITGGAPEMNANFRKELQPTLPQRIICANRLLRLTKPWRKLAFTLMIAFCWI